MRYMIDSDTSVNVIYKKTYTLSFIVNFDRLILNVLYRSNTAQVMRKED